MDQQDIIFFAESHKLFVKLGRTHAAHGVGRKAYDHVFCFLGYLGRNGVGVRHKAGFFGKRIIPGLCPAQKAACNKHRVAGGGQQHGIALIAKGQADVPHALLAAVAAHDLLRLQLYAEAALIIAAHSLQKLGQVAQAVLPVVRVLRSIDQCLLDMRRRFKVRRADRKIIDLFSLCQKLVFTVVQ